MDEQARVELRKLQGEWNETMDKVKEGVFKNRRQLVYIDDLTVRIAKKDATPWVIFSVCGAEKDNAKCQADVMFGMHKTDLKRRKQSERFMGLFLVALGLPPKPDLGELDKVVEPILNKIFDARIEITDKGFTNVTPLGFVKGEGGVTGGDGGDEEDAPF